MKTYYECIPCILQSIIRLFNNGIIQKNKQEIILKIILKHLSNISLNKTPPKIAQEIHKIIRKEINNKDPYKKIKHKYNKLCLDKYNILKDKIKKSDNPLYESLKLAVIGNIIDFGPNHTFNLTKQINKFKDINFAIDDSKKLFKDIKSTKTILYLGDNAGEIIFDRLFLENINHNNVFFAVRGKPVLNDVTREDADFAEINKIAKIIDTGTDIPGIDIKESSDEFKRCFNNADLIISKGQGNYESLSDIKNKNIYFLLMAKCDLVANHLKVKKGEIVIEKIS
jgi:uncharacterized protein with ATP-grasp and redox domains